MDKYFAASSTTLHPSSSHASAAYDDRRQPTNPAFLLFEIEDRINERIQHLVERTEEIVDKSGARILDKLNRQETRMNNLINAHSSRGGQQQHSSEPTVVSSITKIVDTCSALKAKIERMERLLATHLLPPTQPINHPIRVVERSAAAPGRSHTPLNRNPSILPTPQPEEQQQNQNNHGGYPSADESETESTRLSSQTY